MSNPTFLQCMEGQDIYIYILFYTYIYISHAFSQYHHTIATSADGFKVDTSPMWLPSLASTGWDNL